MDGTSQIWSMRSADGTRIATLETSASRRTNSRPVIHIRQHAGPGGAKPTKISREAAKDLLRQLTGKPDAVENYFQWKQTVAAKPMSERVATAFTRPIITALKEALPRQ